MSAPSIRMRPSSGVSKPASIRNRVVLPQPEGPSSAKNSPLAISSETPPTAAWAAPGKRFTTLSIARCGAVAAAPLFTRLDPGPGAGARALVIRRDWVVEKKARPHARRRIDSGVVAQLGCHQRRRLEIGIGVGDRVADRGRRLRPQHVVDES